MSSVFKTAIMQEMTTMLINIEDNVDWYELFYRSIVKANIVDTYYHFGDFVKVDQMSFPDTVIILAIDLGLEDDQRFSGYNWLQNDYFAFRERNPRSLVFVISAYLNEMIIKELVTRGIDREHIFHKIDFFKNFEVFVMKLYEAFEGLKENPPIVPPRNIDPYLWHQVQNLNEHHAQPQTAVFPMLIRIKSLEWKPSNIPDLKILSQIDRIIAARGTTQSLEALQRDSEVISIEGSRNAVQSECRESVPFVQCHIIHNDVDERGDNALIAIIDDGIDIFHEAFLDHLGRTRILRYWDQSDYDGKAPSGFLDGTEYTQADIDRFILNRELAPTQLRSNHTFHGTHVASIAAGRATGTFAGGVAPNANLIVVRTIITASFGNPISTGYSDTHMQALQYVRDISRIYKKPIVINVSQGMNAGAHDGTSALETAFTKISGDGQDAGIAVVKAAGNMRLDRRHAQLTVSAGAQKVLSWIIDQDWYENSIEIEVWFDKGNRLNFTLRAPDGTSATVDLANTHSNGQFANGSSFFMTYTRDHSDNAASMLHISLNPKPYGYGAHLAPIMHGEWYLDILADSTDYYDRQVDAWIEYQQGLSIQFTTYENKEITLSVPGTANHVITVGAVVKQKPFSLYEHSSLGPTRDGRKKPELTAPGAEIVAAYSGSSSDTISKSGTSMAAPHVTGAIALAFSHRHKQIQSNSLLRQFNSRQIVDALTRSTQSGSRSWSNDMGYGVLDIASFFRELGM